MWKGNDQHVTSVRQTGFQPMTSQTPGGCSIHFEPWRTHGEQGHALGLYLTCALHTANLVYYGLALHEFSIALSGKVPAWCLGVIGLNSVGDSDFFFIPRSWHADQKYSFTTVLLHYLTSKKTNYCTHWCWLSWGFFCFFSSTTSTENNRI